ncbi:hypothetical protein ACWGTI_11840 [Mesorhizobium sp. ArgA1]
MGQKARRQDGDSDCCRHLTDHRLYAGEIVYPGAGYGTTTNPALAGEIERLWRLDRSHYLRPRHSGLARVYASALRAKCRIDASRFH